MKRFWLATAFGFFFAIPAYAVPVTLSVGGTSFTANLTAPNAARFAAWAAANYPTIPNPAFTPSCGCSDTIPNPTPGVTALSQYYQGMVNNVISWEKAQAHAAVADPTPLN